MKCPVCKCQHGIEIDMHVEGFAKNLFECSCCGAVWTSRNEGTLLLNPPAP